MNINSLKQLSASDRLMTLQSESLSIEEQTYTKPLNEDEMTLVKEELATAAIAKSFLEEELRQIKEDFKAKMAPHNSVIIDSIASLKTGGKTITGLLYKLPDYDNKMVYFVDAEGNQVSSRMMKPEERQVMIGSSIAKAV